MLRNTWTVTGALVRDTFREAFARKIFWGLFGVSTVMILFFLFLLRIDIAEGAVATISLFGFTSGVTRDVSRLIHQVYGGIATFLYSWGMLLAIFASSGLIPSVLEPGRIELMLSKPVKRYHILLGRYLGNLLVVSANIIYLVVGVWLIFGAKTGIWSHTFLYSIGTTVFMFAVLLSVLVLVGVSFESAALSTMVTVAVGIMSTILAAHSLMERLLSSQWSRDIWNTLYYIFPKTVDIGKMTMSFVVEKTVVDWSALGSSAAFAAVMLGLGVVVFARRNF